MKFFKTPSTIMLPEDAVDEWKEMYGPPRKDEDKAKSLYEAFGDEEEEDDDDDEGDDEDPDEFPDDYPDEEP